MSIATWMARYQSLLGIYVAGDLADVTYYTTKRGDVVSYPRSPPTKPPTLLQLRQRARFQFAQRGYMNLDQPTKQMWEQAMQAGSIDMTGQNAWISLSLNPDDDKLNTINQKAGTALTPPPPVPW